MDVVIVSCGKSAAHRQLTQNAINSCLNSGGEFNIYVVETCLNFKYDYATTIVHKKEPFNYNECLNLGFKYCKGKYIAFCNNDLKFAKDWAKNILYIFENYDYISLSPFEPRVHKGRHGQPGNHIIPGWQISTHITGWCIVVDRDIFKKIGQFHEGVEFWYSDNLYGLQLMKHNIKHALVCNSVVYHIESQTLKRETDNRRWQLTSSQTKKFHIAKKSL